MSKIDISIIVPTHNSGRFLDPTLFSLAALDYDKARYEVIVVDNGSTDGTARSVSSNAGIRLSTEKKRGAYVARNHGIHLAQGHIVYFTDPGCRIHADALNAIERIFKDEKVEVLLGKVSGGSRSVLLEYFYDWQFELLKERLEQRSERVFGYCNNMAVRRSTLERIGAFLEWKRGADTEFVSRCIATSCAVRCSPEVRVEHSEVRTYMDLLVKQLIYGFHAKMHAREFPRKEPQQTVLEEIKFTIRHGKNRRAWHLLPLLAPILAGYRTGSFLGSVIPRRRSEQIDLSASDVTH